MPRPRGSALHQLASQAAKNESRPDIPRRIGMSFDTVAGDLGEFDAELDHENASGPDLETIDPSTLSPDARAMYQELAKTRKILEEDRSTSGKEARKLRSSHHAAGLMDNESVQKAQLFDAIMANPSMLRTDPRFAAMFQQQTTETIDPKAKELMDSVPEETRTAIMTLARQAVMSDPAFQRNLQELQELKQDREMSSRQKNQAELQAAVAKISELGYDPDEVITADVAQQIIAMRKSPAFASLSMSDLIQRTTGINLSTKRRSIDNDEIPPMQRGRSGRAAAKGKVLPRTRNIQEAAARAVARLQRK